MKWKNPHDWLEHKIKQWKKEGNVEELATILQWIVGSVSPDAVQDLFEEEMYRDGFFTDDEEGELEYDPDEEYEYREGEED